MSISGSNKSGRFKELIKHVAQQAGQPAAILIDEYDKPILDAINQPHIATENRDFLRGFYGTIKVYQSLNNSVLKQLVYDA